MPKARGVAVTIYAFHMFLAAGIGAAQSYDRISQQIQADQVEAVPGSLHPLALPESDLGRVPGNMALHHVSIAFRLSPAQQEDLDQLLAEQQDPSSVIYHRWLTPEQYADRFGLTRADAAQIVSWLKSQGLTVESVSRGRTEIFFSGSAAQIEAALHTEIHHYAVNGITHFANASEPAVPSAFAGMVMGFGNLNDFRPKSRALARTASASELNPHYTNGPGNHFLAPDDFAVIYDLQRLYNASLDGTGVTIGITGDSAISLTDIAAFRSAANLPANVPQVVPVGDGTPVHNSDEGEADLDIEWSGAVARNANVIYYVSGNNDAFNALQFAVDQNVVQVISNSFGLCEADEGSAGAQALRQIIQQANSQGQTVTTASGDAGAADCDGDSPTAPTIAVKGLSVDIPAAIPEVTAVGGSQFNGDLSNPSLYWGSVNGAGGGSALGYIPEVAWNDGPSPGTGATTTLAAGGGGASLGSASGFFAKPSWQTGAGVPNDGKRDVPDVSLNASPFHDGYLFCTVGSCTSGFSNGQSIRIVGGTSAGAPTMAGILAIIDQATKSCGLGNVNGTTGTSGVGLYAMATSHPSAFNDVTPPPVSGNIVPCRAGSPSCPASAPLQFGFNTTAGYDRATGLGTIDAHLLTTNWPGYNPGQTISTSTTVVSSSPTANAGATVTFTATVSTSGAACPAITGMVQFTSDGGNVGTPVALVNGVATMQSSSLTVGTHQIVAKYLGDANYLTSSSPAITQKITAVPDYVFSPPNPTSLTLSPGASGQSTLNVSANSVGFTGTINFTCAPSSSTAQIGCSFNPTSIALSNSTTSGQTVMTVTTKAPTPASAFLGGARFSWMAASGGALFAGLMLMGAVPRRRWPTLGCFVLVTFLSAGIGCGGSSSNSNLGNSGTPPGSYSIVVTTTSTTASGAGPTHTTTVSLTVP